MKKLTNKEYFVGGCTALYDALGNTIHSFEHKDTDKVLYIIITDGYENASREYNKDDIKKLIKGQNNSEFIFVGADIDSYSAGSEIGIKRDNIASFKKDRKGTSKLFKAVSSFEGAFMEDKETINWKEELDNYINENEKN